MRSVVCYDDGPILIDCVKKSSKRAPNYDNNADTPESQPVEGSEADVELVAPVLKTNESEEKLLTVEGYMFVKGSSCSLTGV